MTGVKLKMTTEKVLQELQESMKTLLAQNAEMNTKIKSLEDENTEMKKRSADGKARIAAKVDELTNLNTNIIERITKLVETVDDLDTESWKEYDSIEWFFDNVNFRNLIRRIRCDQEASGIKTDIPVKSEESAFVDEGTEFEGTGREERMDMVFGRDGDFTAKSLRRFIEKFRVVKKLNMAAKLVGWDRKQFRADKLKLALHGDAFDFVTFEDSMQREWSQDDEMIIEKLKDRYLNIQAIEVNILNFEKSSQGSKELLNEYLARLQQLVKDAYEGDNQKELDRKVAWKFVSGVFDERVRRKLMEEGWMKNRKEAKPLDELLKMAEITKQTEDAVKALKPEGTVASLTVDNVGMINANRFKRPSTDSNASGNSKASGSSNSSGVALDFISCWYCKKLHRGGWFYCMKRKKENPNWRPDRKSQGNQSQSERSSTGGKKDF